MNSRARASPSRCRPAPTVYWFALFVVLSCSVVYCLLCVVCCVLFVACCLLLSSLLFRCRPAPLG